MEKTDRDLYMTADEAASYLNVSHSTLYAYVSRKNIRSRKVEGSRSRLYWAEDITRIAKKERSQANLEQGLFGQHGASTSITLLTDSGLFYRGKNVIEVASTMSVEEAAEHIWQSKGLFNNKVPHVPNELTPYMKIADNLPLVQKALLILPMIEQATPRSFNLSFDGYNETSVDALRWITALVSESLPSAEPIHLHLSKQMKTDKAFEDLIRQTIILSIDHELDPSTVAVRAAANTGITPYMAIISGLIAFHGRRLAYGEVGKISNIIELISSASSPKEVIYQKHKLGEPISGFGASVHSESDPRAEHLLALIENHFSSDSDFKRIKLANEAARELGLKGLGYTLLILLLGKKIKQSNPLAIAGIGRCIGWLAHANEQFNRNPLNRPRAQYSGDLPS